MDTTKTKIKTKITKKVTPLMTCTVCKKKYNKKGVRIKKFKLVAA